jgi:hypothetical protein
MHLYCRSGNSCSNAHLPSNSSSPLLLFDYTVSAATSSCRLAVPKMTPEPSLTMHILGLCYSAFPAPRDMLLHILVSRTPTHGCCYQLVGFCVTFCTVCCAWLLSLNLPSRFPSLFTVRCGFYESARVYMFSGYHRDVNEICALPGPIGCPEMSIRHFHSTVRKNCRWAEIWLIFSHQSCLSVLDALPLLPASSVVGRKFGEMVDVTCQVITVCVQWRLILRGPIQVCLLAAGFRPGRYHLDRRR